MLLIVRCKPVGYIVEEREPFHLRETSKIDVRALFLHIDHPVETSFHLFQILFFLVRMQYVVQYALLVLFEYVVASHHVALTLYQVGHDLLLDGITILFGTHAVVNLLL